MKKKVLFYTSCLDDINIQQFYQIDFDIIRDNGYDLTITDKRIELFKFWKYDILFEYFYTWGFFKGIPFWLGRKKIFFTGGIDSLNKNTTSLKRYLIQKVFFVLCYVLSTKCIIVSDNDMENIKKIYKGHFLKKLELSYHTIDVNKFLCDLNTKENLFLTICWQGNELNIERKGVDKALLVYKYLVTKKEFSNSKFIIVGKSGPATPILQQMINDYGLSQNVFLVGAVSEEDKVNYLKKSKYYFQLSYYEGFGLAALEAKAAGNIIIHSGKGGLKYVVGNDGILVNRDNIENECEYIYKQLIDYDPQKIHHALDQVRIKYQYDFRRQRFSEIFSSH